MSSRSLVLAAVVIAGLGLFSASAAASAVGECQILPGGTIGEFETAPVPDRAGLPTDRGPGAYGPNPTVNGLPTRVDLHSPTTGQNRNYYFAVKKGRLYVKPNFERTGRQGNWQLVPAPDCLDGDIQSIDADDDELTAINSQKQIFGMDQALSVPARFNWTSRWGFPIWLGDGYTIPDDTLAWAWTVISPRESEYWVDPAGNHHTVGEGKVSHVLSLRGDRRRITMNDPWLSQDRSYEVCGPRRGTFKISNIAASGSVLFVIGSHGDMFTRLWDFDIAGLDDAFFDYSYEDQRGLAKPKIQLPGAHWVQQPKIPGEITNRISITTFGRGTLERTLRVEGRNSKGMPGFWQKELYALDPGMAGWKFIATPKAKVTGRSIPNPAGDGSGLGAGKEEGYRYLLDGGSYSAEIPDFNVYCNRSLLRVTLADGKTLNLDLFLDDTVRIDPRARGLDDQPRLVASTIGLTSQARQVATGSDDARHFIDEVLGGKQFNTSQIEATSSTLRMTEPAMVFTSAGRQPAGKVPDPGFGPIALEVRNGRLGLSFSTLTESPADITVRRIGGRGTGKGKVVARMTRQRSFTWKAARLTDGRYRVTAGSTGLGGRLDARRFTFERRNGRTRVVE